MNITISPYLPILLTSYAILFLSLYGWGNLVVSILKINLDSSSDRFFTTTWIGWVAILIILQVVNIFLPLDWRASVFVYLSGVVFGGFRIVRSIRDSFRSANFTRRDGIRAVIFFCIILLAARWAAFTGMDAVSNYDSGLYHFNIIRWMNTYAIIPGLGDLHSRLAYNQSFFLYAASLNFFPYFPYGHVIANSFLFLLAFADLAWHLYGLIQHQNREKLSNIYFFVPSLCGLTIIIYISAITNMSAPTPDTASSIIQVILYVWFIQIIDEIRHQKFPYEKTTSLFILATCLITVKLSNLVFVTSMMLICLFYIVPRIRQAVTERASHVRVVIFLTAIMLVWMVRGFYLSGYPVYPLAIGGLHVDWAVPVEKVKLEADSIYSWARQQGRSPSKVLANWNWFRPWLSHIYREYKEEIVYPIGLAVVFGFVTLVLAILQKKLRRVFLDLIFFVPIGAGILYWFFTAPDPRFAHALFLLLLCSAFFILMMRLYELTGTVFGITINIGIFILCMLYVFPINQINLSPNFPNYPAIPTTALVEKQTDSGLKVYVPAKGDQCWDSPLPCTPYFNPALRLRIPGKIASGFTQK